MTTRICISNQKGGVAKTTTAVNLAHALVRRGRSVLLVDLDAQASATRHLGCTPSPAVRNLLLGGDSAKKLIEEARPGLHLLPSNRDTAVVRDYLGVQMSGLDGAESARMALSAGLDKVKGYDYILVDSSPAIDVLTLNALMFADELMIPVAADYLSAVGVSDHLRTLERVEELGGEVELSFIVPTKVDRTKRARRIVEILTENFGDRVTDPIRVNTHLAESAHHGRTIFEHAPRSNGAADYTKLAERVDHE